MFKFFYKSFELIIKGFNKTILVPGLKASLGSCGENVRIAYCCDFKSPNNIYIGSNSQIGPHSLLWTTRAKIIIDEYVLCGPNLTIITGDHRIDVLGKHIIEVSDSEKVFENDMDVNIENGVWIGANVTILKGVTIGKGCVIGAGSVVTKSTEPYGIYGGIPAYRLKERFSLEEIEEHESIINKK